MLHLAGLFSLAWYHHVVVVHAATGGMKVLYFTFLVTSNASAFEADSSQVEGIARDVDRQWTLSFSVLKLYHT
eukprot:scaffold65377_cov38-Prasinocladus_malaysianus.AAC.2